MGPKKHMTCQASDLIFFLKYLKMICILGTTYTWYKIYILEILCIIVTIGIHCSREMLKDCIMIMH